METIEIKDINVTCLGDFVAATKNALPPQDAHILPFEPFE